AIANGAVEVEQQGRRRRIAEIVPIEDVEYFHQCLHLPPVSYPERTRQANVPAGKSVVAANGVAQEDASVRADAIGRRRRARAGPLVIGTALLRRWLGRVPAEAVVGVDLEGELVQRPQIQAMTLVAVAVVVLAIESIRSRIPEAEWIALVVVVRLIDGQRVVRLILE